MSLVEKGNDPRDVFQLALQAHRRGDLKAAGEHCKAVLEAAPDHVDALHLSGMLQHQRGDSTQALQLLDRAVLLEPDRAAILSNRASVQLAIGDAASAERDARKGTERDPTVFGAWFNLGLALRTQSKFAAASSAFARASALRPVNARALLEWFSAAAKSSQMFGILQRIRQGLPSLSADRDLALRAARRLEEHGSASAAFALLSRLSAELPDDAEVRMRMQMEGAFGAAARLEYDQHQDAALAAVDLLLEHAPRHRGARMLRASLLGGRGEASASVEEYRRLAAQIPDDPVAGSAMLIAMQNDQRCSAEDVSEAHRDWASHHMPNIAAAWTVQLPHADPDRRLRIGWLSPRFFSGLIADFFLDPLRKLDRKTMFHVLYDSAGIDDAKTGEFRKASDLWRNVEILDDAALCEQIRADKIDILVELSGHSPGNRLRALAARPAPVQITWLDYFHSTGTNAIDFLISDAVLSPPELAKHYTERLLSLPSGRLHYSPSAAEVVVSDRASSVIRFASFSRVAKINDDVLACWARILAGISKSVLRLKARAFDSADERAYFLQRCERHAIDVDRVELVGYSSVGETLAAYGDVDVALDTFPFSGCATSLDALWMGVPVVTRIGQTMVGRQTASLLASLELQECIAENEDDYVRRALAIAGDVKLRETLRRDLRDRVRERLCDTQVHAKELSTALRESWLLFCSGALT
jgi:protein O-GlcNAc transferase